MTAPEKIITQAIREARGNAGAADIAEEIVCALGRAGLQITAQGAGEAEPDAWMNEGASMAMTSKVKDLLDKSGAKRMRDIAYTIPLYRRRPPASAFTVKDAMDVLSKSMKDDPGYAWSWHCNIAMAAQDAGAPHKEANERAAGFMRTAFGVDTSKPPLPPPPAKGET